MLDEMRRVFQLEIDTLVKVRDSLDESYSKAADLLSGCKGKVVVTGIGKSGLIAQKIAATMVSTGTPALFLHAGDGMHGDVGIIAEDDVVLAISKSGETEELLAILIYVKKIGVPVVSITTQPASALGRSSDLVLCTPVEEEACPLNLAPTSSTTAALVVGDALAMSLMKRRGLTPEGFALFHPGGQLGKRLLITVQDIMRAGEDNPVVNVNDTLRQTLYEISNKLCGAVSVVDDQGNLAGLITDYDVRAALEESPDFFSLTLSEVMNSNPTFIRSDRLAIDALEIMENRPKPFLVLPVLAANGNRVVGMVHVHDLVAKGL